MTVPIPPPDSIVWEQPWLCTYDICPLEIFGQLNYRPSLAGNALLMSIFVLVLITQVGLAIKYRTWGYMTAMVGGTALEIIGYGPGRIALWKNDFDNNNFIIYLVGCTIGPAFFSAAIYLCFARFVVLFGQHCCRVKPRLVTIMFILCDLVALVLQAAGGALASLATNRHDQDTGINVMIAGLASQVASTSVFAILGLVTLWFVKRGGRHPDPTYAKIRNSSKFKFLLGAISVSTILILERCCYRVAELSGGFGGKLANDQPTFMILDGAAMAIVAISLTVAHPGLTLGREVWNAGGFRQLKRRGNETPPAQVQVAEFKNSA